MNKCQVIYSIQKRSTSFLADKHCLTFSLFTKKLRCNKFICIEAVMNHDLGVFTLGFLKGPDAEIKQKC